MVRIKPTVRSNNKPKSTIQMTEILKELSFKKKSFSCKLGFHKWECLHNGLYNILACKDCKKKHPVHKKQNLFH